MNRSACARRAAARTSSSVASGRPKRMLSAIERLNRLGTCGTIATASRKAASGHSRTSSPSSRICPSVTSYSRGSRLTRVDLPEPVVPTTASASPGRSSKLVSISAGSACSPA